LSVNRDILANQGLYIPRTGQIDRTSGHHNIAFQLNSDPRFASRFGTVADLINELSLVAPTRACISSEDFEFLCMNTKALRSFVVQCAEAGYKVKPVFFLRPQADYSESLYDELVKWGYSFSFDEFLHTFMADGLVRHRSQWCYCAD